MTNFDYCLNVARAFTLGLTLLGMLPACSTADASRNLSLADSSKSQPDAESERLRRMQAVRLVRADKTVVEEEADELTHALCGPTCTAFSTPCQVASCGMSGHYCRAEILLAMTGATRAEVNVDLGDGPLRVLPQSTATNAALAQEAFKEFGRAMQDAAKLLDERPTLNRDEISVYCVASGPASGNKQLQTDISVGYGKPGQNYAQYATAIFVDSYRQAQEANEIAVKSTVAVADAQRDSTPSLDISLSRAFSGASLSRAAAAHLLAGGMAGFKGSTTEAPCSSGNLSGSARAALSVIRDAAPDPLDVIAIEGFRAAGYPRVCDASEPAGCMPVLPIETFLDGSIQATRSGSIRERLKKRYGGTLPANMSVADSVGLTTQDFVAARQFAADEIVAFSRSLTAVLTSSVSAQIDPSCNVANPPAVCKRFAATAGPPPVRDPSYYNALARIDVVDADGTSPIIGGYNEWLNSSTSTSRPTTVSLLTNLSDLTDYGVAWARYFRFVKGFDDPSVKSAMATIAPGSQGTEGDEKGLFEDCVLWGDVWPNGTHYFVANGFSSADKLRVVRGEDGLSCATQGSVEGAPCNLDDYVLSELTGGLSPIQGYSVAALGEYGELSKTLERWYLIRPKNSIAASPKKGEWQSLLGFVPYASNSANLRCRAFPIVPDIIKATGDVLAPSRNWCANPAVTCAGTQFDERLALEDELTQDGNPVESSWQHYLSLAKSAAEDADSAGKEYIQSVLAKDQDVVQLSLRKTQQAEKAVGQLEALQQICGSAVDPATLLKSLGTDLHGLDASTWQTVARNSPSLKVLADCIGGFGEVVPYAHLGDQTLCAWKDSSGEMCPDQQVPCPDVVDEKTNVCSSHVGQETVTIPQEQGLGFFSTRNTLPAATAGVCDAIRQLRRDPGNLQLLTQIKNSNYFHPDFLKKVVANLGIDLRYGDTLSVTAGGPSGGALFSTSRTDGPWPCSMTPKAQDCATTDASLFCMKGTCADDTYRKRANERLYLATLAAVVSAWSAEQPIPNFQAPVYMLKSRPSEATKSTFVFGNSPINQHSNDVWRMFEADLPAGSENRRAHSLGKPSGFWDVSPDVDRRLAFGRLPLSGIKDRFAALYGGLALSSGTSDGYFVSRLQGYVATAPSVAAPYFRVPAHFAQNCPVIEEGASPFYCQGQKDGYPPKVVTNAGNRPPGDWLVYPDRDWTEPLYEPTVSEEALLDGLELSCDAMQRSVGAGGASCDLQHPPTFSTLRDLPRLGDYLQCLGDQISRKAATALFPNFPKAALDPLRSATNGAYKPGPGKIDAAISDLRTALSEVALSGPTIGRTIRDFGTDMHNLEDTLVKFDTSKEILDVQFASQALQQATNCIAASASAFSVTNGIAGGVGAAATCVNSLAQIGFADTLRNLQSKSLSLDRDVAINDFNGRFATHSSLLNTEAIKLNEGLESISKQLGVIEGLHAEAARALDTALWYMSDQADGQGELSAGLNAKKETDRIRYERALLNAKKLAYLAKISIEQRLGVSLKDMRDNLPLVEAPSNWESTACATTGVDFASLASPTATDAQVNSFADQFIGDYVTKLQNVVESYRLVHNFHEGTDRAVISVRDDLQHVRAECDVASPNLLYYAAELGRLEPSGTASRLGWTIDGCGTDGAGDLLPNCISATPLDDTPFVDVPLRANTPRAYSVKFGDGGACPSASCGWRSNSTLSQTLTLDPGRYRFSWYTTATEAEGQSLGSVQTTSRVALPTVAGQSELTDVTGWKRFALTFDLTEAETVIVGFAKSVSSTVKLAAPMLDVVDQRAGVSGIKAFSNTSDLRVSRGATCEDTDGKVFRAKSWTPGCLKLCPDGYSSNCSGAAKMQCYHETSFYFDQRGIERGRFLNESGFAKGNFNYRIESMGLNFVGTGLRSCADSQTPTSCYAAGNIPYSLSHEGPYFIRNHFGEDFRVNMFTGHVEHARGLATERYLTNPLSRSEEDLVDQYLRGEFAGRPLDGNFVLRVWDTPGMDFDAIQDVQVLVNYRYWTRFD